MKSFRTPGGRRLKALREFYGKTQLDIELDASLGMGYLQRLEHGRVQQPERDTLERILSALHARYTERREVLELFGYLVDAPLPDETDMNWAVSVCQHELDSAVFPAYLLDCAHRILCWNRLVPEVFQTGNLKCFSMLKLVFDAAHPFTSRIVNGDTFFPAQIRALRYEMQRFHDEAWYAALLDEMAGCEKFKRWWENERREIVHIPARPLTPLIVRVGDMALSFRLIAEPFIQDHRFRVIFFLPTDSQTSEQCLAWLREDAILNDGS